MGSISEATNFDVAQALAKHGVHTEILSKSQDSSVVSIMNCGMIDIAGIAYCQRFQS